MRKTSIEKLLHSKLSPIRMILLDVDGVLSDGRIIYGSDGAEYKVFDARDGFGIVRAIQYGIVVILISGRKSLIVNKRARKLGIREVYQNIDDKVKVYKKIKKMHHIDDNEVCFIGDDEFDIPLLSIVGFSVAPKDAVPCVKNHVNYVTKSLGGRGAVREVLDMILRAKGLI